MGHTKPRCSVLFPEKELKDLSLFLTLHGVGKEGKQVENEKKVFFQIISFLSNLGFMVFIGNIYVFNPLFFINNL